MRTKPQVGKVLKRFSQTITIKRTTQTVEDFEPVNRHYEEQIKAVVQPANPENLNIGEVDFSLRYFKIHSTAKMKVNDLITYEGTDYKIIEVQDWSDYGYCEAICEEVK